MNRLLRMASPELSSVRNLMHRSTVLVAALALSCVPAATVTTGGGPRKAEILWDTFGVPHIFAADRNGLAYAFGWAQMQNHGDLLLRLYQQARGRGAELLGEDYLEEDRWVWTLEMPALAQREYAAQSPEMRAHLEAFAAGINDFARANPALIGDSVRAVLPVTPTDIVGHGKRVMLSRFITSSDGVRDQTKPWMERGSNGWAIAPSRSASGKTLLLANPHLPWEDLFTWMEAQYSMPGIDLYGAALVGFPLLQIAFNSQLGWTHTVNTQDGEDLYELTLAGAGDGYLWDGSVRAFDREEHVIKTRGRGGAVRTDTMRVKHSIHGPVVAEKAGKAIALRVVGLAAPTPFAYEQWWNMGRARDLAEFEAAIRPNQISSQNIVYGDRDGHIMAFYGGNSPVRRVGDRVYWDGIVRGDSSSNLWTTLHPYADIPKTLDPPSGWVQNANDPPWWSTFPVAVRPSDYPSYLASREMLLRPQRSARMLAEDSSITFEELVEYKHSTRMEMADRLLDDLLLAARQSTSVLALDAARVLDRWDRSADNSSRGAVLFTEWWKELGRLTPRGKSRWAVAWTEARPRETPDGLSDPALAVSALEKAATRVRSLYGATDVVWGDVYRLRRDGVDLPANGAQEVYGVFRVTGYSAARDNRYEAIGGDSYVVAVEFSTPVRARTVVGSGNASRAGSPHRTDQLALYSRKELKPVWRTRPEIESHLEKRETLVHH